MVGVERVRFVELGAPIEPALAAVLRAENAPDVGAEQHVVRLAGLEDDPESAGDAAVRLGPGGRKSDGESSQKARRRDGRASDDSMRHVRGGNRSTSARARG